MLVRSNTTAKRCSLALARKSRGVTTPHQQQPTSQQQSSLHTLDSQQQKQHITNQRVDGISNVISSSHQERHPTSFPRHLVATWNHLLTQHNPRLNQNTHHMTSLMSSTPSRSMGAYNHTHLMKGSTRSTTPSIATRSTNTSSLKQQSPPHSINPLQQSIAIQGKRNTSVRSIVTSQQHQQRRKMSTQQSQQPNEPIKPSSTPPPLNPANSVSEFISVTNQQKLQQQQHQATIIKATITFFSTLKSGFKKLSSSLSHYYLKLPSPIRRTFAFTRKAIRLVVRVALGFFLLSGIAAAGYSLSSPKTTDFWTFILNTRSDQTIMKYYGDLQGSMEDLVVDFGKDPRDDFQRTIPLLPPPHFMLIDENDDPKTVSLKERKLELWDKRQRAIQRAYQDPVKRAKMKKKGMVFPEEGWDTTQVDIGKVVDECNRSCFDEASIQIKSNQFRQIAMKDCYAVRLDMHDFKLLNLRIKRVLGSIEKKLKQQFNPLSQPTVRRKRAFPDPNGPQYSPEESTKVKLLNGLVAKCKQIYEESVFFKEKKGLDLLQDTDDPQKIRAHDQADFIVQQSTRRLNSAVKSLAEFETRIEESQNESFVETTDLSFLQRQLYDLDEASTMASKGFKSFNFALSVIEFTHCSATDNLPFEVLTSFALGIPSVYGILTAFRNLSTDLLFEWTIQCENLEFFDHALDLLEAQNDARGIDSDERVYTRGLIAIPHKSIHEKEVLEDVIDIPTLMGQFDDVPQVISSAFEQFKQRKEAYRLQQESNILRSLRLREQWGLEQRLRAAYDFLNARSDVLEDDQVVEKYQQRFAERESAAREVREKEHRIQEIKLQKLQREFLREEKKRNKLAERHKKELDLRLKEGLDVGPKGLPKDFMEELQNETDNEDLDDDDGPSDEELDEELRRLQLSDEQLLQEDELKRRRERVEIFDEAKRPFLFYIRKRKIHEEYQRRIRESPQRVDRQRQRKEIYDQVVEDVLGTEEALKVISERRWAQYYRQKKENEVIAKIEKDPNSLLPDPDASHFNRFRSKDTHSIHLIDKSGLKQGQFSHLDDINSPQAGRKIYKNNSKSIVPDDNEYWFSSDNDDDDTDYEDEEARDHAAGFRNGVRIMYSDDPRFTPESSKPKIPSHLRNLNDPGRNQPFTSHPDGTTNESPVLPTPSKQQQQALQRIEALQKRTLYDRNSQSPLDYSLTPYDLGGRTGMNKGQFLGTNSRLPPGAENHTVTHQILSSILLDPGSDHVGLPSQSQLHVNIFNDTATTQIEERAHLKALQTNTLLHRVKDPAERKKIKEMQTLMQPSDRLIIDLDDQGNPVQSIEDIYNEMQVQIRNLMYAGETDFIFFPLLAGQVNSPPRLPFRATEINGEVLKLPHIDRESEEYKQRTKETKTKLIKMQKLIQQTKHEADVENRIEQLMFELFMVDQESGANQLKISLLNAKKDGGDDVNNQPDSLFDDQGKFKLILFDEKVNSSVLPEDQDYIRNKMSALYRQNDLHASNSKGWFSQLNPMNLFRRNNAQQSLSSTDPNAFKQLDSIAPFWNAPEPSSPSKFKSLIDQFNSSPLPPSKDIKYLHLNHLGDDYLPLLSKFEPVIPFFSKFRRQNDKVVDPNSFYTNPELLGIPTYTDPDTGEVRSLADIDPVLSDLLEFHANQATLTLDKDKSNDEKAAEFTKQLVEVQRAFENSSKSITKTLLNHSRQQIDALTRLRQPLVKDLLVDDDDNVRSDEDGNLLPSTPQSFTYRTEYEKAKENEQKEKRFALMRKQLINHYKSNTLTFYQRWTWGDDYIIKHYGLDDEDVLEKVWHEALLGLDTINEKYVFGKDEDELAQTLFHIPSGTKSPSTSDDQGIEVYDKSIENGFYSFGGGRLQIAGDNPISTFANVPDLLESTTRPIRRQEREEKRERLRREKRQKRLARQRELFGPEFSERDLIKLEADLQYNATNSSRSTDGFPFSSNNTSSTPRNADSINVVKDLDDEQDVDDDDDDEGLDHDSALEVEDRLNALVNMTTQQRVIELRKWAERTNFDGNLDEMIELMDSNNPESPYHHGTTFTRKFFGDDLTYDQGKQRFKHNDFDNDDAASRSQDRRFKHQLQQQQDILNSIKPSPEEEDDENDDPEDLNLEIAKAMIEVQTGGKKYNPFDLRSPLTPRQLADRIDEFSSSIAPAANQNDQTSSNLSLLTNPEGAFAAGSFDRTKFPGMSSSPLVAKTAETEGQVYSPFSRPPTRNNALSTPFNTTTGNNKSTMNSLSTSGSKLGEFTRDVRSRALYVGDGSSPTVIQGNDWSPMQDDRPLFGIGLKSASTNTTMSRLRKEDESKMQQQMQQQQQQVQEPKSSSQQEQFNDPMQSRAQRRQQQRVERFSSPYEVYPPPGSIGNNKLKSNFGQQDQREIEYERDSALDEIRLRKI